MSIKSTLAFAVALSVAAQYASASNVFLTDVSPTATMTVTFPGNSPVTTPYTGRINWSFDRNDPANAGLAALIPGTTFSTFCIEGTQDVNIGANSSFANLLSNLSLAPQDNVGSLYQMGANATTLNKFWDAYYDQASLSNANAAAFQLGVWEIVYDNGTDLTSGLFSASAVADATSIAAYAQAQSWLANLGTASPSNHYQLFALSDPCLQDQVFGIIAPGEPRIPVPVPAALPAGISMLGALGLLRKLRRTRA